MSARESLRTEAQSQAARQPICSGRQFKPVAICSVQGGLDTKDFSYVPVVQTAPISIQAQLCVDACDSPQEKEANSVATKVMGMTERTGNAEHVAARSDIQIQRKCSECEAKSKFKDEEEVKDETIIQRKENSRQLPRFQTGLRAELQSQGAGSPLSTDVRSFFETRFGRDFSSVRIHTDAASASLADRLNARAFTIGQHITFAANQYSPQSPSGQHLLAHELVHTIQQSAGGDRISRQEAPAAPIADSTPTAPEAIGDDDRIARIKEILTYRWVGPRNETELEETWASFGDQIFVVAKKFPQLWLDSVDRGAELGKLEAVKKVEEDFRSDIRDAIKHFLDSNEQYVLEQMRQFGLAEGPEPAAQRVDPSRRLQLLQASAQQAISAKSVLAELRKTVVGFDEMPADEFSASMVEVPVTFDPDRKPQTPNQAGHTWEEINVHYAAIQDALRQIGDESTALYSLLAEDDSKGLAKLAEGSPEAALGVVRSALTTVLTNIRETRPKVGSELDEMDLPGIQKLLLKGGSPIATKHPWSEFPFDWAAKDLISRHETKETWKSVGLGLASIVAFAAIEFATAGTATFFLAAGAGLGLTGYQVGAAVKKASDLSTAAGSSASSETEIVSQAEARQAKIEAVIQAAFAVLDVVQVGKLAKAGKAIQAAGRTAAEESAEVAAKKGASAVEEVGESAIERRAAVAAENAEPLAQAATQSGGHTIKVTPGGWLVRCSAPCRAIREEFARELAQNEELDLRLLELESRADAARRLPTKAARESKSNQIAAEASKLEDELVEIRRAEIDLPDVRSTDLASSTSTTEQLEDLLEGASGESMGDLSKFTRRQAVTLRHDRWASEIFGSGKGRSAPGRVYDKFYGGYDIEFKANRFARNNPQTAEELLRMSKQIDKDIALNGKFAAEINGTYKPHWHFLNDPKAADEMMPILNKLNEGKIPWSFGRSPPF